MTRVSRSSLPSTYIYLCNDKTYLKDVLHSSDVDGYTYVVGDCTDLVHFDHTLLNIVKLVLVEDKEIEELQELEGAHSMIMETLYNYFCKNYLYFAIVLFNVTEKNIQYMDMLKEKLNFNGQEWSDAELSDEDEVEEEDEVRIDRSLGKKVKFLG
jgi:hypothetical protein